MASHERESVALDPDLLATISAADPLNLVGIVTPGPRVVAIGTNTVTYRDGIPVEDLPEGVDSVHLETVAPN